MFGVGENLYVDRVRNDSSKGSIHSERKWIKDEK